MSVLRDPKRRFLVPEVLQTSQMDCGPAALGSLLRGLGRDAGYEQVRHLCQTGLDGTSVDVLEDVLCSLGLRAAQVMVPPDHVLRGTASLPAIAVASLPGGWTHFLVLWRRLGPFVQVMDPAAGRSWMTSHRLRRRLYRHSTPVPAAAWRDWASSDEFLPILRNRLAHLRIGRDARTELVDRALADPTWRSLGRLDAATRFAAACLGPFSRARRDGPRRVVPALSSLPFEQAVALIPNDFWSVGCADSASTADAGDVLLQGVIVVRVEVPEPSRAAAQPDPVDAPRQGEEGSRPMSVLYGLFSADGGRVTKLLVTGAAVTGVIRVIEGFALRDVLDALLTERSPSSGFATFGVVLLLALSVLLVEFCIHSGTLRLGRQVETGLRHKLAARLPHLSPSYFRSRPVSDLAERAHSIHTTRGAATSAGTLLKSFCEIVGSTVALTLLDTRLLWWSILLGVTSTLVFVLGRKTLANRELTWRDDDGPITRLLLDALLGGKAVLAHGARNVLASRHEALLHVWRATGWRFYRASLVFDAIQLTAVYGVAIGVIVTGIGHDPSPGTALLLVYLALRVPIAAESIGIVTWEYPRLRNTMLRLAEPLNASLTERHGTCAPPFSNPSSRSGLPGMELVLEAVDVTVAGVDILKGVTLHVRPGERVALVGPSGAGKTTLVGLLVGTGQHTAGSISVDSVPIEGVAAADLRRTLAWVDPRVHLWNESVRYNLVYGSDTAPPPATIDAAIRAAHLGHAVDRLGGLEASIGDNGAFLSAGEAQCLRLARAFLRTKARLVILDEPFHGLDRPLRAELYAAVRTWWPRATLLYITHELAESRALDRVVVMVGGEIAEEGAPAELSSRADC